MTAAIAYVNELNASEPTGPIRAYDFVRSCCASRRPGEAGRDARSFDTADSPPALPDETSTGPYRAQFVFALGSGLSRILAVSTDESS